MLTPHTSPILTILINGCFNTGVFPDNLKKKGAAENPSNYRPISLLSIFSKIIEKNNAQKAL